MNNKDSFLISEAYSKVLNRTLVQESSIEQANKSMTHPKAITKAYLAKVAKERAEKAEAEVAAKKITDNQKEEVKEEAPVAQENAGVPSVEETLRGCSVAELHKVLDVVKTALGSYNGSPESRQGLESMIGLTQKELDSKLHGESL